MERNNRQYSLSVQELIKRPLQRNDQPYEFMNKMNDEEIEQFEKEVKVYMELDNVSKIFPEYNAELIARFINRDIIYKVFQMETDIKAGEPNKK
jgi:hypothetical protein